MTTIFRRENYKRRSFNYQPGQWVLELVANPTKLGSRTKGPYRMERVHCNGTLNIWRAENVIDRLNIQHVRPFFMAAGDNNQGPVEPH